MILWLSGCLFEAVDEPTAAAEHPWTVGQLWDGLPVEGDTISVEDLVVSSPVTADGEAFYAQDPEGGPRSGLRVSLVGPAEGWPPPIGTAITLVGPWDQRPDGPELVLTPGSGSLVHDLQDAPAVASWSDDPDLAQALVELEDLEVTSARDPLGHADTDGPAAVGGLFDVGPGYGRSGDLSGVLLDGRISARDASDWSGRLEGDPPGVVRLDEIDDLPPGTPVRVADLLAVTPFSRDGRWMVVQDLDGTGRWVDGEAWGLHLQVDEGDLATWTGEVRATPSGAVIRAWDTPLLGGTPRTPILTDTLVDGALVTLTLDELAPPDAQGDRLAGDLVVDDRFVDLSDLISGDVVTGPMRGATRIAPLPSP